MTLRGYVETLAASRNSGMRVGVACTGGSVGVRVRYIVHDVLINLVDFFSSKILLILGTIASKNVRCSIITTVQF